MRIAHSLLMHVCLGAMVCAGLPTALALWSSARSAADAQHTRDAELATLAAAALPAATVTAVIGGHAPALTSLQRTGQELLRRAPPILGVSLLSAGTNSAPTLTLAGKPMALTAEEIEPLLEGVRATGRGSATTDEPVRHFTALAIADGAQPATAIVVFELDPAIRATAPLSIWPLWLALASVAAFAALVNQRFGRPLAAIEVEAGQGASAPPGDAAALALLVQRLAQRANLSNRDIEQRVTVRTQQVDEHSRVKDEQLANTVHELRTPLTTILASLSILEDGIAETAAERERFLHNALSATRHLTFLCNDILDTTAFEAGRLHMELRPSAVQEILDEAEDLMRPIAIGNDITLTVEAPAAPLVVIADRARVLQVLFNLLGNALKYSRPRCHVTLRVDSDRDSARFAVTDDGIGVPAASRDKLFTKFGRAHGNDASVAGTGIGLYLSRILVEHMRGAIGYQEAAGGQGSTFWFSLPLQRSVITPPIGPGVTAAPK